MSAEELFQQLSLPTDSRGFVRRKCPRCRLPFKTRPYRSDGVSMHRVLAKRLFHGNEVEAREGQAFRACLYCGATASPDAWLTDEQRTYVEDWAHALSNKVRFEQLAHVTRTLSENPRPTFVAVPPEFPRDAMPPEPDDLHEVPLLCCSEEAKAIPGWLGPIYCPRCGAKQRDGAQLEGRGTEP